MTKNLYDRKWRKRREQQLRDEPLCRFCAKHGRVTQGTVADHVTPHRGDPVLFAGPLQTLCKPCHDSAKQQLETTGRIRGNGIDGVPIDPAHPWNTERPSPDQGGEVNTLIPSIALSGSAGLESRVCSLAGHTPAPDGDHDGQE